MKRLPALLTRLRAGEQIVLEDGCIPLAVIYAAGPVRRKISECIALAKAHEKESGEAPVLDPDFAEDLDEIIKNRQPGNPPAWD